MIKRILVPLDGSDLAAGVLPFVEELAKPLVATVYLVQVVDMRALVPLVGPGVGVPLSPEFWTEQLEAETKAAESYLSALAEEWRAKGFDVRCEVLQGDVGQTVGRALTDYAHRHEIDIIAMSTHGRSGLSRLIFGSVAEQVVREAGVPVLLIKPLARTAKS